MWVLCRLFSTMSCQSLPIDKRNSAPHFLLYILITSWAGVYLSVTMNKKLRDSYTAIIDELDRTEIKSFKIGITHNLDERKEKYVSEGYSEIYSIATGDNESIIQAESDLIKEVMLDDRVSSKCDNLSTTSGLGQTDSADILYIVVRIKFDEPTPLENVHLENLLFANGFPISL